MLCLGIQMSELQQALPARWITAADAASHESVR